MVSLPHALKTKGLAGTLKRATTITKNYGLTPKKMLDRVRAYSKTCEKLGVTPTFPVTARTLSKHPELVKAAGRAELAVHGHRHSRLTLLSAENQEKEVRKARQLFEQNKVTASGFRAPYLASDENTLKALAKNGFEYDSSVPVLWNVTPRKLVNKEFKLALQAYHPSEPGKPEARKGVLEIPVSLPDDEMLVDRLDLKPEQVLDVWSSALKESWKQGGLFVLQLHPERFDLLHSTLTQLIKRARELNPPVWITSLSELCTQWKKDSSWPKEFKSAMSVTGDVDALSLGDFA